MDQSFENEPMPKLLLIISPQMIELYNRYHDCIRFDVTYALCRLRNTHGKSWGLGIFSGFN